MKISDYSTLLKERVAIFIVVGLVTLGVAVVLLRVMSLQANPSKKVTTYRAGQIPHGSIILTKMMGKTDVQGELFRAPLNWDIYWDYLCNDDASPGYFKVTVIGDDGSPRPNLNPIDSSGISGFGDQKYTMTTRLPVLLKVESNCSWHVTAVSPPS